MGVHTARLWIHRLLIVSIALLAITISTLERLSDSVKDSRPRKNDICLPKSDAVAQSVHSVSA